MKFSLIHPSRSRPEKSKHTVSKWISFAEDKRNIEVILSLDLDDERLGEYLETRHISAYMPLITPILNDNKSAVEAINNAAKQATGDIFIVVSDDTDCKTDWDKTLRAAIGQSTDFVMKVNDGIQKRIITMPIMDRIYYNRDGHIYDPCLRHSWADTMLTEKAHIRGRVIERNDIKFIHLHPEVTKEPKDALYLRNDKTHNEDRHIFEERKRLNFGL